jgi:hypothetical protein
MTTSATLILQRLEEINVTMSRINATIAHLASAQSTQPPAVRLPRIAAREVITTRLRARCIPSSTIQQVNAVLDDLEAGR